MCRRIGEYSSLELFCLDRQIDRERERGGLKLDTDIEIFLDINELIIDAVFRGPISIVKFTSEASCHKDFMPRAHNDVSRKIPLDFLAIKD